MGVIHGYYVQQLTLPGKRISTTEATHNHHLAKKPYSMATDEVTMSFLVTGDYYMKKYFDTMARDDCR